VAAPLAEQLAAAFRLHEKGRLAESAERVRKLLKQAPELAGAHYLAGLIALDRGRPPQALKHFVDAARFGPESAALQQARGIAELRCGHAAAAAGCFARALELAPGHAPTQLLLAEAQLAAGDESAASRAVAAALADSPENPDAFHLSGTIASRQGRLDDAIADLERALVLRPGWVEAMTNLGGTLIEAGAPTRAVTLLRDALAKSPDHLPAARNLGLALEATGAEDAAAELFAALAASGDVEGTLALGQLEMRRGRMQEASAALTQAVARAPDSVRAHYALAESLRALGDVAGAGDHYRACLALDAADSIGAGLGLALATGAASPATPPQEFVRALFDSYAGRFDRSLLESLGYRAPALLRAALEPLIATRPPLAILDLGCGTGLAGLAFADRTVVLDGIDLSPRMLEQARARGIYRTLIAEDLVTAMRALPDESYDLLLAADVLVYLGDLAPLVEHCARLLKPGGLLAFTVERLAGDAPYRLHAGRRYAHSRSYVESLAAQPFTMSCLEEISARSDRGQPVAGLLAVMRRGSGEETV
jgi:predicted TPR repeat methyltransferase